jgi:hypothetical protein
LRVWPCPTATGPQREEVDLEDLAGTVDRAPDDARPGQVARAHLAQVVVEDRLAAPIAELCEQFLHARARQARVGAQQAVDLVLKGSSFEPVDAHS